MKKKYILAFSLIIFLSISLALIIKAQDNESYILFCSDNYLWRIKPDGTEEEKLCDISSYSELILSPDRNKIAAIENNDIIIMNTDGSGPLNISRSPEIESLNSFSPDGEKLVCLIKEVPKQTKGYLGLIKTNGNTYTKTEQFSITKEQNITWSTANDKISIANGNNLYIMPLGGEWIKSLAEKNIKGMSPFNPSWSPDGDKIAFRANKSGIGDLWIVNVENENLRPLYRSKRHNAKNKLKGAEWSPQGEALVFEIPPSKGNGNEIYMVLSSGKSLKFIGRGYEPIWSMDGTKIIYRLEDGRMKFAKTGITSYSNKDTCSPFWSPDRERLVYTNKNKKEAWILDLEREENTFLTGGNVTVLGWIEK